MTSPPTAVAVAVAVQGIMAEWMFWLVQLWEGLKINGLRQPLVSSEDGMLGDWTPVFAGAVWR